MPVMQIFFLTGSDPGILNQRLHLLYIYKILKLTGQRKDVIEYS